VLHYCDPVAALRQSVSDASLEATGPADKLPAMKSFSSRGLLPLLRQAPSVLGMSAFARLAFALFFIALLWAGVFWALSA
jgi:hypothetical protein